MPGSMMSSTTRSGRSLRTLSSASPPAGGRGHREAGEPQARRQQLADVRLVVDNKQMGLNVAWLHEPILPGFPDGRL